MYQYAITFPLDSEKISGSFCEFRGNHLHTGIDISTNAMIGLPVYAPEDGYISYIKQDFLGYGKAIFLQSQNHIYVFGHLNGFSSNIESQLSRDVYRQVLYPLPNTINIKQGDIIAYTGRSGTIIPHLHFEIRSMKNNPISPYSICPVEDIVHPEINTIIIEPADDSTIIDGYHDIAKMQGKHISNAYYNFPSVNIEGTFYIYPIILDRQLSETARLFVKSIDIYSSKNHIFSFNIDSASFAMSSISAQQFRSDLDEKDNNYIFNPHAAIKWFASSPMRPLDSERDTVITIVCVDFNGNRSIATLAIDAEKPYKKHDEHARIYMINGKLVVSFPKEQIPEHKHFEKHNKNHLYYIFNTKETLKSPFSINNVDVQYDFLYIDSNHPQIIDSNIRLEYLSDLYSLFNTKDIEIEDLQIHSPLYEYQLNKSYLDNTIAYIFTGKTGEAMYMKHNDKFRYIKTLSENDTVYSHYLQSFILANDVVPPAYSKSYIGENEIKLSVSDDFSGLDWRFISDSNTVYNIPDPQMGTIHLYIRHTKDSVFVLKDLEDNRITVHLGQ